MRFAWSQSLRNHGTEGRPSSMESSEGESIFTTSVRLALRTQSRTGSDSGDPRPSSAPQPRRCQSGTLGKRSFDSGWVPKCKARLLRCAELAGPRFTADSLGTSISIRRNTKLSNALVSWYKLTMACESIPPASFVANTDSIIPSGVYRFVTARCARNGGNSTKVSGLV